jgi:hypothetical protein
VILGGQQRPNIPQQSVRHFARCFAGELHEEDTLISREPVVRWDALLPREARLRQRRAANGRHQRSPEGRLDHRDR